MSTLTRRPKEQLIRSTKPTIYEHGTLRVIRAVAAVIEQQTALAQEQYQPGRNLTVRLLQLGRDWRRSWSLIENLTPDKLEMAKAASLLWVSGRDQWLGMRDSPCRVAVF